MAGEQEPMLNEPLEVTDGEPAIVGQEDNAPVEGQEPQSETDPEGGEPAPEGEATEDLDIIEHDGKQYQVPKAIKAGIMMQADYTRKTQEVAEQRKELESRSQQIAQQSQASEEELTARASLIGVNQALQQYSQVNWDQLEQQDPIAAQTHWRKYQTLQQQQQQIQSGLSALGEQRSLQAQQETAKRVEETRQFAQKEIRGWTPELDTKMTEFAVKELGFDRAALGNAINPQVYRAMYLAYLGQQTLNKPANTAAATTQAKPLSTVGAKASPASGKSLADMTMDEYVAHRKRGGKG